MRRRTLLATTAAFLTTTAGCMRDSQTSTTDTAVRSDAQSRSRTGAWPQIGYDARKTSAATNQSGPTGEVRTAWTALGERALFRPVVDDALYLTERWTDGGALSLRERDGSQRWTHSSLPPTRWPPALGSDSLFVMTRTENNEVRLRALDPTSGNQRWTTQVPGPASSSRHGNLGPTVHEGRVYIPSNTGVRAFDTATGKEQWVAELNTHVVEKAGGGIWRTDWTTPAVGADHVYTYDLNDDYKTDREVYAVTRETGATAWTATLAFEPGWMLSGHPVVGNKRVFLRAFNPAGGAMGSESDSWRGENRLLALSTDTGTVTWKKEFPWKIVRSPAYAAETVYVGTWNPPTEMGRLHALDASDGSTQWTYETGAGGVGRPAVTSDRVYIRQGAELAAIHRDDGSQDWWHAFETLVFDPVVANGRIYALVMTENPDYQRVLALRER